MKILFGNVNVRAANTALKVFPEIFQIVNVRIAFGVFARAVIHRLVRESFFVQSFVGAQFVGVNRRALRDVFFNDWLQSFCADIRNNFRHHSAVALQHSKHDCFVSSVAASHSLRPAADIGFINFNIAKQREFAVNLRHVFADFVTYTKRALVGHAKFPHQFHRGNAMPRSGEKVNRVEPQLHRCPAIFKQRSGCRVYMMSAPLAGVSPNFCHARPVGFFVALRAFVALPKAAVENVLDTSGVIRERCVKFSNRYADFLVVIFHASKITQKAYLRQGDNSVLI